MTAQHVADTPQRIADRFVALFGERAVGGMRDGFRFDGWGLTDAGEDGARMLDGKPGRAMVSHDEALIIYQRQDEAIIHVRGVPVDRDRVISGLAHWAAVTPVPFAPTPDSDFALDLYGPHPRGGFTHILLSLYDDEEVPGEWEAYASVAWVQELPT